MIVVLFDTAYFISTLHRILKTTLNEFPKAIFYQLYNFFYLLQIGSEDALSSVDDLNINEQLSIKTHTLEQVSILSVLDYLVRGHDGAHRPFRISCVSTRLTNTYIYGQVI